MEIGTVDDDLKKTCHGMDASVKSENSIENPCETFPSMGAALNAESKDENALAILTNDNTVKLDNQTLERGECTHDAKKTNFNNPNCEAQINVSQSNDEMVVDNIPSSTEEVFNTENNLQKFDSVSKTVLTDLVNSVVDMVKHNSTNPQEANTNLNDNVAVQQLQQVNREDENIPTSNLSSSSQKNVLFTLNQFSDSSDSPRHSRRKRIPKKLDDEETKKTPPNPVPFVKEKLPVIETPILYKIADLVWSYVPGHPLWPCMLTNDPLEEITTKMQGGGQKPCRAYHVQFLGDSPEHGWVRETRVFPYNERSDYERIIKELALKNKRQPTKIPRLEIPSRLKEDWEAGIVEIAEAVSFTAEERIAKFEYDFRPFMKKLKNKLNVDEECADLLEDLLLSLCGPSSEFSSTDLGAFERKLPYQERTSSALCESNIAIADHSSISEKPDLTGDDLYNSGTISHFRTNSLTSVEIASNVDYALVYSSSGSTSSHNLLPNNVKLKMKRHRLQSDDMDFTALATSRSLHECKWLMSKRRKYNSESEIAQPTQSVLASKTITTPGVATHEVNLPARLLSAHACAPENDGLDEKAKTFKECFNLIKRYGGCIDNSNIISKERAIKAVSALKVSSNNSSCSYADCSCSALMQCRGSRGGCQYTNKDLLDALQALKNGFSLSAVALNFRIPRSSLQDYLKGRTNLTLKHHSACKLFSKGVSVIIDGHTHHVKALEDCRRIHLTKAKVAKETPRIVSSNTPKVILNRTSIDMYKVRKNSPDMNSVPPTASAHTKSLPKNDKFQKFSKKELLIAWRNFSKKKSLIEKNPSHNTKINGPMYQLEFQHALKAALRGTYLDVAASVYNLKLEEFYSCISFFLRAEETESDTEPVFKNAKGYSMIEMFEAMDDIISGKSKNYCRTCRKYNIPGSTLRDVVYRNRSVYASIVNSKSSREERIKSLSANRKLIRFRGPLVSNMALQHNAKGGHENSTSHARNSGKLHTRPDKTVNVSKGRIVHGSKLVKSRNKLYRFSKILTRSSHTAHQIGSYTESNAKRKFPRRYTPEDLVKAVQQVLQTGALSHTAKKYNIPESTLRDKAYGRRSKHRDRLRMNIPMLQLGAAEEQRIACALNKLASWGWRLTSADMISQIKTYIESCTNIKKPGDVTNLWLKYFCQRNDVPSNFKETLEDNEPDPFKIFNFFDLLEKSVESCSLEESPCNIYLVHEFVLSATATNKVRILAAVNAAGGKYPPLHIFEGNSLWCSNTNSYPGSQFALSDNHCMTSHIFTEWFNSFTSIVPRRPLLLLYDGSLATLPLNFVQTVSVSNVVILKLPYRTANNNFSLPYGKVVVEALSWYKSNCFFSDKAVNHSDIVTSVTKLWQSGFSAETIVAAFDTSGIFPTDREKYPVETLCEEKFRDYCSMRTKMQQEDFTTAKSSANPTSPDAVQPLDGDNADGSGKAKVSHAKQKKNLKRLNNEARTKSDNLHQIKRGRKPGIKVKSGTLKLGVQGAKLKGSIGNTELLRFSNDHQIKDKDATDDKQTVETLIESPQKTDNMDLFNCYCEKRKGPLVTENPRLTPEQVEALIFMEWESLTPEKQQKYGRKRIVEAAKSPTTSSISITSPKRKRGRPFKHPQPTEAVASHGAEIGSPKQFSCSACNTSYASKTSLGQHKRWCLAENKSKDLSNKVLLKSPNNIGNVSDETWECTFTCSGCQDKFFSAKSLQIHNKFCSESDTQAGSPSANTKRLSKQTSHGSWAKTNSKRASMANGSLLENAELLANSNLISLNANKSSKHPKSGSGMATNGRKQSNQDDSSSNGSKGDSEWPPRKIRSRGPQLGSMAKRENICIKCEANGEDLLACNGGCCQSIHPACIDGETPKGDEPYKCSSCINNTHPCFICKEGPKPSDTGLGEIKRCTVQNCGRSYHATCLHLRKVAIMAAVVDNDQGNGDRHSLINSSRCTLHHCATCASKLSDNHNTSANVAGCRMFKCVRCPTAYHAGDDCIAAGSIVLPGLNIICPEHFEPLKTTPYHQPVHISWCFICSKGGQLLCCDSCPAAFHPKCVDMEDPPEGEWFCRDCRYRRRPLYGDIVWVKLGSYRWWPGEITHPNDIPDNIQNLRHGVGEFVVNFFGSNDYFWLNKRRVFAYQEGDTGASSVHCSRGISSVFNKALRVAADKFEEMTTQRQKIQDVKTLKKRPQYKFIKTNKPVGNVQMQTADVSEIPRCHCKRTDPNPCGAESECINRMLMFECHATLCPAGEKCQNQHFQKRDYPESEVFKTSWGGWGLRVKTAVKKGQFVSEYVGELVDGEECLRRIELAHKNNVTNFYMLTIDKDRIIDAGPKGNFSRFMNHCCDPSCETQKWTINGDTRVGLFARRDILAGEELTFNYNLDCLGNDKTPCMCGSKNCSGFIGVRPKPQLVDGHHLSQKAKRKRKRTEQREIPKHDDFCFRCRQVGTLVCCDVRGCQRAFCLSCLRLTKPPFGKWECPWHHCDFCGRRAQSFCHFCPNSFCASHISNQLVQSLPNGYDCCTDHNPEVAEYEMEEAIAAVVASMIPQENWDDSLEIKDVDEPVPQEVRRPVKPRVSSLKEETSHKTNQTATTSAPRKRGRPRKVVDPIVKSEATNNLEMFKALSPPSTSKCPSHSDEVITESDSDEELGRPTSSPVRRKRAKRQYFKGRKKRRRSKVLPLSQLDHAANEDEGKSPVADLVVVKEPEASELMKDATDSPANSTEH